MVSISKAVDTVVIGAGFAGINVSLKLQKASRSHVVLESKEQFHAWKAKRWTNFRLNTPTRCSVLPGQQEDAGQQEDDSDLLGKHWDESGIPIGDVVASWDSHVNLHDLPIVEGMRVVSVRCREDGEEVVAEGGKTGRRSDDLLVETEDGTTYRARNVVSAIGIYDKPKIPPFASKLSPKIEQLYPGTFKDASQITGKSVLVVGSAQTGVQIADELAASGKHVILATSNIGGCPRNICGRDAFHWMEAMLRQHRSTLENEEEEVQKKPARPIIGADRAISYHSLARRGVTLTGRVSDVTDTRVFFENDLAQHVQTAQETYDDLTAMMVKVAEKDPDASPYELEEEWEPYAPLMESIDTPLLEVDLKEHDVRQVIWATGWNPPDFTFVQLPGVLEKSLNQHGTPICMETPHPGFFFLGADWLRTRSSALLLGMEHDADHLMGLLRD